MEIKDGNTRVENRVIRNFLRALAAIILVSYTCYFLYKKWSAGAVDLDSMDVSIISSAIAIWLTVEGVRAYVTRKLEK